MIEVAAMFNAGVGVLDDDEEAFLCIDAGRSPPRPRVGEARAHGRSPVPDNTTEMLICPGWETLIVQVSHPVTPGRDKRGIFVSGLATGTKSFCPGW